MRKLNMKKIALKPEWRELPGMDEILDAYDDSDLNLLKDLIESSENRKEILEFVYLNAVKDGWVDCVRYCLSAGVDPAAHWGDALVLSARNGHVDVFKLINDTVDVYNTFNNYQVRMAIIYAAMYSPEIIDVMIKDYPDVYNENIPGIIEYLIDRGDYGPATYLYEKAKRNGIDINEEIEEAIQNMDYPQKRQYERSSGYDDRFLGGGGGYGKPMYLLEDWTFPGKEEANDMLITGAMRGEMSTVTQALNRGADIHIGQDAPLFAAVYNCHPEIVELLLERGADPFARNGMILRISKIHGCPEAAEILDRYSH